MTGAPGTGPRTAAGQAGLTAVAQLCQIELDDDHTGPPANAPRVVLSAVPATAATIRRHLRPGPQGEERPAAGSGVDLAGADALGEGQRELPLQRRPDYRRRVLPRHRFRGRRHPGAPPRRHHPVTGPRGTTAAVQPRSRSAGALPVYVYFHGGGWTSGDKASLTKYCASQAEGGMVVVNVNYRKAPRSRWPTSWRTPTPRWPGSGRTSPAMAATDRGSCSAATPPAARSRPS